MSDLACDCRGCHVCDIRGCGPSARIAKMVAEILVLDACEVIPCSPEVEANLRQTQNEFP
jgi:hypothetical protein